MGYAFSSSPLSPGLALLDFENVDLAFTTTTHCSTHAFFVRATSAGFVWIDRGSTASLRGLNYEFGFLENSIALTGRLMPEGS